MSLKISVIIPTLNEAKTIGKLVSHLFSNSSNTLEEIIVVDGGSKDATIEKANEAGAKVIQCTRCGRATQMNEGAKNATGDILYFVHSDTLPPKCYLADIRKAIQEGFSIGCFRSTFDSKKPLLKLNGYFSRFDQLWCRGGDQALFVTHSLFEELGGYKDHFLIMEEYDFIIRARKKQAFKIIPNEVLVSARKYDERSFFKVQFANLVVFNMFRFGASQEAMVRTYKRLLN